MKKAVLVSMVLLITCTIADVTMKQKQPHGIIIPEHPIAKPEKPVFKPPYHPGYIPTGVIVETQSNCSHYIELIREKDAYIASLLSELAILRSEKQKELSEKLQKEHNAELKKFEQKKRTIKTSNHIIITDKPKQ